MSQNTTKRVLLANRPEDKPVLSDFNIVEGRIPTPDNNEVLVRTRFLSVDPYMRLRMRDIWPVGEVMPAGVVGEVVESKAKGFSTGDIVTGNNYLQELKWAEHTIAAPSELRSVETGTAPISTALGVLGMRGRTAYFGMLDVGAPKPSDTVVVSSAAGAVGSVAGQIASLAGCNVIGIAGSDEKIEWITDELGFDAAVNYQTVDNLKEAIESACSDGVDVYFDNVGGTVTDAVAQVLNSGSRVVVCGQIAHYNTDVIPTGPRLLPMLNRTQIEDFGVSQYTHRYEEANERLIEWVTSDDIEYHETIIDGLENAPSAFRSLFEGENIGKQLIKAD